MQTKFKPIIVYSILLILLFAVSGNVLATGTLLMLGAGQEFRFDLPLIRQELFCQPGVAH